MKLRELQTAIAKGWETLYKKVYGASPSLIWTAPRLPSCIPFRADLGSTLAGQCGEALGSRFCVPRTVTSSAIGG
jgi:hypothetical protein